MSSIEEKLNEIFSRLDEIEKRVGIQPKNVIRFSWKKHTLLRMHQKFLVAAMVKVRQYIKYNFLDTFRVGQKVMITSESLKRLIENNKTK